MGGAGLAGSGGVGVGGWQLYEGVINPTTHRQLTNQGYQWKPIEVPIDDDATTDNKFNWQNWGGCVNKLFSNLSIKKEENDSSSTATATEVRSENNSGSNKKWYFPPTNTAKQVSDKSLTCALLDWRLGTNKVYFKSEVAFRDTDHGFIMWNGLSSTNDNKVTFEYRLLLLKKATNSWTIESGWGWSSPSSTRSNDASITNLVIELPKGQKWSTTSTKLQGYSERRIWSGIARVDNSSNKHLLESLEIYVGNPSNKSAQSQYAEFFGKSTGKWIESSSGYAQANKQYSTTTNSDGWKNLSASINLGDSLEEWYKPFMQKKVSWTTCDSWSANRKSTKNMSEMDKEILNLCYDQSSKK